MAEKVLFLYVYFIFQFGYNDALHMNSYAVKFAADTDLSGYGCREDDVLFNMNGSSVECTATCWNDPACSSLVYYQETRQCTGCSSFNGIYNTDGRSSRFLKRGYQYLGCYRDCPRILSSEFLTLSSLTTEYCINHCLSKDAAYAMTEFTDQCFCGNSVDFTTATKRPDAECNYNCGGDASQKCGGSCLGSLYRTGG